MSEEAQAAPAQPAAETDKPNPVLLAAGAAAAIVVVLLATISLVLLLLISHDVGRLGDQVRKLNQNVRALEETLDELKQQRAALPPPVPKPAVPRATHIDAGDPQQDCIIRPGSKNPLGDCLK